MQELGFDRGENEPSIFYHPTRDLVILLYVDDVFLDGYEDDIQWFLDQLRERFHCKDPEWLSVGSHLDYLGMEIILTNSHIYLSMEKYIDRTLTLLGFEGEKVHSTPIDKPIDNDSPPLEPSLRRLFMSAVGCLTWLVNTGRPDVAYAHSRVSQHMANPTISSFECVVHIYGYLKGSKAWCLGKCLDESIDLSLSSISNSSYDDELWDFYSDTDHAGNSEDQNKRKSQIGITGLIDRVPFLWGSRVSSIAFAHPLIGEAHADISSAASEIYGTANATYDILHSSYAAEEMGLVFDLPFTLKMDNTAAEIFCKNSAFKSRLKHIDARQEWVKTLRDRTIMTPVHVDTKENVADIFTKIFSRKEFERLRSKIMIFKD